MRYLHLLAKATSQAWHINESALRAVCDVLEARLNGHATPRALMDDEEPDEAPVPLAPAGIGIIPIHGILAEGVSPLQAACGMCDYDGILAAYAAMIADSRVSAVVLHIDSPGGTSQGSTETFEGLLALRATTEKPLLAFARNAHSAAYHLATAADSISGSITSSFGNIGTKLTIEDRSEALAKEGRRRLTIKSGTMKDIMTPDRPATAEEITFLQDHCVGFLSALFVRDVQSRRPQIGAELYESSLFYHGTEAIERGLADDIAPSFDAFLTDLVNALRPGAI